MAATALTVAGDVDAEPPPDADAFGIAAMTATVAGVRVDDTVTVGAPTAATALTVPGGVVALDWPAAVAAGTAAMTLTVAGLVVALD